MIIKCSSDYIPIEKPAISAGYVNVILAITVDLYISLHNTFTYQLNKDATETKPSIRPGPQSSAVQMDVKDEETCWNGQRSMPAKCENGGHSEHENMDNNCHICDIDHGQIIILDPLVSKVSLEALLENFANHLRTDHPLLLPFL
ncbi:hypothetical protein EI555_001654, partial [Monodon monoceros]